MLLARKKSSSSAFCERQNWHSTPVFVNYELWGRRKTANNRINYSYEFGYWVARLLEL
jgi:hypothetical protein